MNGSSITESGMRNGRGKGKRRGREIKIERGRGRGIERVGDIGRERSSENKDNPSQARQSLRKNIRRVVNDNTVLETQFSNDEYSLTDSDDGCRM